MLLNSLPRIDENWESYEEASIHKSFEKEIPSKKSSGKKSSGKKTSVKKSSGKKSSGKKSSSEISSYSRDFCEPSLAKSSEQLGGLVKGDFENIADSILNKTPDE